MTIVFVMSLFILLGANVYAYSGNFSFNINVSVTGARAHQLSNARATATSTGNTYQGSSISTNKLPYVVAIEGTGLISRPYYSLGFTANGSRQSGNFGTVKKDNYRVIVAKNINTSSYDVRGNGTINQ